MRRREGWIRKWMLCEMCIKIVLHHLLACRTAVVFALKSGDRGAVEDEAFLSIRLFINSRIRQRTNNSISLKIIIAKYLEILRKLYSIKNFKQLKILKLHGKFLFFPHLKTQIFRRNHRILNIQNYLEIRKILIKEIRKKKKNCKPVKH